MPFPLPGRGAAIRAMMNIAPYLLNFLVWSLRVLAKSFSKNTFSLFECLVAKVTVGPIIASMIAGGIRLPVTAKRKVLVFDKPRLSPRGIASLISRKGTIDAKKTKSSDVIKLFNPLLP